MRDLKNSETVKNLMRAFAGESQARNRYTFAASTCCQEKLHVLEAVFLYTAQQELAHAKVFYSHLKKAGCENVTITANYPIDLPDQPLQLLELARRHELDEFGDISPRLRRQGPGGGLPGDRPPLPPDRGDREGPRRPVRAVRQIPPGEQALRQRRGDGLDLPQLRPYPHRQAGARQVPRLLPRPGILYPPGAVPLREVRTCIHRRGMADGRGILPPCKAKNRRNTGRISRFFNAAGR